MNPSARRDHDSRIREQLVHDLGPQICGLLDNPRVIEIMLNPDGTLWVEYLGEEMKMFGEMSARRAESLIATVASALNETINAHSPTLQGELPFYGSRFQALLPPVVAKPTFTIRQRAIMVFTLKDYVKQGIMSESQNCVIQEAVRAHQNILIVGGTGSGKTTLTNAVIQNIVAYHSSDRLVILEDTRELQCSAANSVLLRVAEHADMTQLLKLTLRMRPDRILVGEVRDGAALALLKAWNTGHPGGVATIHANSARDGLVRIEQLIAEATPSPVPSLIAKAVDLLVFIRKRGGKREVSELVEVQGHDGQNYITQTVGG